MHIDERAVPYLDALAANIKRLGDLGLDVHITGDAFMLYKNSQ